MTIFDLHIGKDDHSLERYRPMLAFFELSLFFIGTAFWLDAMAGAAGFKESTWGEFAYFFPAEMWALLNMGASAMTFIGIMRPVKRMMVTAGAGLHCLQFMALTYSTMFSGGEFVIGLYAGSFFLPLHIWIMWEALRDGGR